MQTGVPQSAGGDAGPRALQVVACLPPNGSIVQAGTMSQLFGTDSELRAAAAAAATAPRRGGGQTCHGHPPLRSRARVLSRSAHHPAPQAPARAARHAACPCRAPPLFAGGVAPAARGRPRESALLRPTVQQGPRVGVPESRRQRCLMVPGARTAGLRCHHQAWAGPWRAAVGLRGRMAAGARLAAGAAAGR